MVCIFIYIETMEHIKWVIEMFYIGSGVNYQTLYIIWLETWRCILFDWRSVGYIFLATCGPGLYIGKTKPFLVIRRTHGDPPLRDNKLFGLKWSHIE